MNGDQRRGTCCLDVEAGSFQIELERDHGRRKVASIPNLNLIGADPVDEIRPSAQIARPIPRAAHSYIDAGAPGNLLWIVTRIFEGFDGTLEEYSMLRVEHLCFAGVVVEVGCVEVFDICKNRFGWDVGRVSEYCSVDSLRLELFRCEEGYRLYAVFQVLPELRDILGSRKPAGHTNDCQLRGLMIVE